MNLIQICVILVVKSDKNVFLHTTVFIAAFEAEQDPLSFEQVCLLLAAAIFTFFLWAGTIEGLFELASALNLDAHVASGAKEIQGHHQVWRIGPQVPQDTIKNSVRTPVFGVSFELNLPPCK